ncbi:MAG: hypothetical protein J4F50_10655 [Acidimicrobiia bacterium]|nr:hypothetical protein [Acidimicrobiia bacterium]
MIRRLVVVAVAVAVAVTGLVPVAAAQEGPDAPGGFSDVTGGVHQPAIDALDVLGVFEGTGCGQDMFCPGGAITRWTMAVWLVRVLDEAEPTAVDASSFADVDFERWWLAHVERLAELEVTKGCLTEPLRFCPDRSVTRSQMATFLARAFGLEAADSAGFTDTEGNAHETNIDALAAARITAGCQTDPPRYCPDRPVTRSQMATFLARALGLVDKPAPPEDEPPADEPPEDEPPEDEPPGDDADSSDPADGTGTDTPAGVDPSACRPGGVKGVTAGFPLPGWAAPPVGTLRVAVLFLDFPDAQATYSTEVEAAHGLPYAEEYLEAASYGRIDVEFVPLHGWLRAPRSVDDYLVDTIIGETRVSPGTEAVRLADPMFDFTGHHVVMTVLPSSLFAAGGHTSAGAQTAEGIIVSMARINTAPHPDRGGPEQWGTTAAHELAHGLGLLDLYAYNARRHRLPPEPTARTWVRSQFGLMELRAAFAARPRDSRLKFTGSLPDGPRVTGYAYSLYAGEMLAWSRWQLGWLEESQIHCINAPEATVALGPVADPGDATAMAAVPLSDTEVLVIESRRKIGYDREQERLHPEGALIEVPALATEGVLVYTVDASLGSGELPIKVAGDPGNGRVDDYPILARSDRVVVRGYTITVTRDDGDTHTVTITKTGTDNDGGAKAASTSPSWRLKEHHGLEIATTTNAR